MKQNILVVILLLIASTAWAGKLAVVDLQKAGGMSIAGKAAQEKIAAKVESYQTKIDEKQAELQKMEDDLKRQSFALSAEARAEKERSFQQKVKDFQRFAKDAQEELEQEEASHTRKILEEMREVVSSIGKDGQYDLIVEKALALYVNDAIDITDEVIKDYDKSVAK